MNNKVYCYENNDICTPPNKIYKIVKNIKHNLLNTKNDLIIAVQTSSNLNIYMDYLKFNINYFVEDCLEFNQYTKITLISFNLIINSVELTDNYIDEINNVLTFDDGVDYNALNKTLLDKMINKKSCDLLLFMSGYDPYLENIDESLTILSSFINSIECKLDIYSVTEDVNNNILNKYTNIIDNKIQAKILTTPDDFENLIKCYIPDIPYITMFNKDYRLYKCENEENKYYMCWFDIMHNDNEIKIIHDKLNLTEQLYGLNQTIIIYCQTQKYTNLNIYYKKMRKIVNQYTNYLNKNNYDDISMITTIKQNLKYMLETLMNMSQVKLKEGELSSQFSDYFEKSSNVLITSKYRIKFQEIISKNVVELKDIDKNLDAALNNDIMTKFIKKYQTIYDDNNLNNLENKQFKKSLDIYYSSLSITDWYEEMTTKGVMGLMIRVSSPNIAKIGYNLNSIEIKDITTTIVPVQNILEAAKYYYEKYNKLDFGVDSLPMISGNAVGNGNAILPLYICKQHWSLATLYLKPILGMMLCQNPVAFNIKHIPFVFSLFFDMINRTFNDNNNANNKWIQLLFSVFRTCVEIAKDNKFNKGVHGIYKRYNESPLNRTKNVIPSTYSILGQILVSSININTNDLTKFCIQVYEEKIRRRLYTHLLKTTTIVNFFEIDNQNNIKLNFEKFNNLLTDFSDDEKNILENLLSFCKFYTLLNTLIKKHTNFNKFIEQLDNNYSLLNDIDLIFVQKYITENLNKPNITIDNIFTFMKYPANEYYYKKCVLQGIDHKNNKIRCQEIKKGNYIDICQTSFEDLLNTILFKYNKNKEKEKTLRTINYLQLVH